jgi:hypothetical protein
MLTHADVWQVAVEVGSDAHLQDAAADPPRGGFPHIQLAPESEGGPHIKTAAASPATRVAGDAPLQPQPQLHGSAEAGAYVSIRQHTLYTSAYVTQLRGSAEAGASNSSPYADVCWRLRCRVMYADVC